MFLYSPLFSPSKSGVFGKRLKYNVLTKLYKEGLKRVFLTTYPNATNQKWHVAIGYRFWGRIHYLRWLGNDRWWIDHRTNTEYLEELNICESMHKPIHN